MSPALPPVHRTVGRVIQLLRRAQGLRQEDLAARVGLAQPNLSRIESAAVEARPATLRKLAAALGVTLAELLSEKRAREAELRWRAALTPRNAGQLFAGRLSAVPLYSRRGPHRLCFDAAGQLGGTPELILQLPPLSGRAFALRTGAAAAKRIRSLQGRGAGPAPAPREVLIFADQPPPCDGDVVFAASARWQGVRKVSLLARERLKLVTRDASRSTLTLPRAQLRALWRLVRVIRDV